MIIYIQEKFTLEIAKRFWLSTDFKPIKVLLYEVTLKDSRSKKVLTERRIHLDEILTHVEEMLPDYFNQIKNQIKQEFNLN